VIANCAAVPQELWQSEPLTPHQPPTFGPGGPLQLFDCGGVRQ